MERLRTVRKSDCPIHYALEIFGDRWTLLIIRDLLFQGKSTYGEFSESEEKIASNILADRLHSLECAGLVIKAKDPGNRRVYRYALTEKGVDLLPMILEMVLWSATYNAQTGAPAAFIERAKHDRAALIAEIRTVAMQHLQRVLHLYTPQQSAQ